ncbi:hypothetical protein SLE2022_350650 [Rubroshorea leprosula]
MAATGKAPEIQNSCSNNRSADLTGKGMMGDSKAADLDKEEPPEKTEMQDVDKWKETNLSSSNLGDHSAEIPKVHHRQNSLSRRGPIAGETGRADGEMPVEQQLIPVENLKNAVKLAFLLITISTTAIVACLSGGPKAYSSSTSKFLLKSGILAMFASLFSALGLLMLSTKMLPTKMLPTKMPPTKNAKLSCSNRSLIIIIGASFGLMMLAIVLFMAVVLI